MSEEYFVKYGSPTLAGIKAGSLFAIPLGAENEALGEMRIINRSLTEKGLAILPLKFMNGRVLVYMFRPRMLEKDLENPRARKILSGKGYRKESCSGLLSELCERMREETEFPHEIGLFLGYPPEDVEGFIKEGASHSKATGCWKVYGSIEEAEKCFRIYERCTRCYERQLRLGKTLSELAVAT